MDAVSKSNDERHPPECRQTSKLRKKTQLGADALQHMFSCAPVLVSLRCLAPKSLSSARHAAAVHTAGVDQKAPMLRLKFRRPIRLAFSYIFICFPMASAPNTSPDLVNQRNQGESKKSREIKEIKGNQRNQNYNENDKLGRK